MNNLNKKISQSLIENKNQFENEKKNRIEAVSKCKLLESNIQIIEEKAKNDYELIKKLENDLRNSIEKCKELENEVNQL